MAQTHTHTCTHTHTSCPANHCSNTQLLVGSASVFVFLCFREGIKIYRLVSDTLAGSGLSGTTLAAPHAGATQEAASGVINDTTRRPRQRRSGDDATFQIQRKRSSGCYGADSPSVNAPLRKRWEKCECESTMMCVSLNGNEPQS